MELFNKYKNKNFAFVTNYINNCINDDALALSEEILTAQLSGTSQKSFEEFLLALVNACDTDTDYNANILYREGNTMSVRRLPKKHGCTMFFRTANPTCFSTQKQRKNLFLLSRPSSTGADILSNQTILIEDSSLRTPRCASRKTIPPTLKP